MGDTQEMPAVESANGQRALNGKKNDGTEIMKYL